MDAEQLAKLSAKKLLLKDAASRSMGMELKSVSPGNALVSMAVRGDMVNGHDIAHGGVVFTLADSAFACACNSYNIANVAQSCSINFIRPALLGDILLASATEVSRGRRSGVYDVRVENGAGKLVAAFRGQCASLDKVLVEI
jgi:acyl-CoA thioesterase